MRYISIIFLLFSLSSFGQLTVSFEILSSTCSTGDCFGQIKATASNGTAPYTYQWVDNEASSSDPSVGINLCGGTHQLIITDDLGLTLDTTVFLPVLRTPKIQIDVEPGDTIYIKNPTAEFNFTNLDADQIELDGWLWNFGDESTSAEVNAFHTYTDLGRFEVSLRIIHQTHCDTTFYHLIDVKSVELFIPNVFTPNGDGKNDTFVIASAENAGATPSSEVVLDDFYVSNELIIYNRWSQVVYETKNYQNDWDGDDLPDGVYFYVLKCVGETETDVFRGSLTILANQ